MLHTAKCIKPFQPDFVSITYGAGGSTRERTLEYGELLKDLCGFEVMPHLTCVGHSRDELKQILKGFSRLGFHNIMTLRGDPPKGEKTFQPHPDGLRYASELVTFIRQHFPEFCLGVSGYPEKHPEAVSLESDLDHLKTKVDAGADFITTQLFFDNRDFFAFEQACRDRGIDIPIIPGILPAHSYEQVSRFCGFCSAKLPRELAERLQAAKDPAAAQTEGIRWATRQIEELLEHGAPGIHLYLINRPEAAGRLFREMKGML